MLSREEKYIYEWETKRGKGKWSYIFLTALVWGTLLPCMVKAFKLAINGRLSLRSMFWAVWNVQFLKTWGMAMAACFLFALLMWQLAFKKYMEFKEKQQGGR